MEKERRLWLFDALKSIFTIIVVVGHSRYISSEILFEEDMQLNFSLPYLGLC